MAKLKVGDDAPDFEQPWTGEGDFKLSEPAWRWVVLAFYPGDESADLHAPDLRVPRQLREARRPRR